ncbi:MAG: chemotaxis protein [Candidatus Brocadiaceae bacterium]|nr:chemotaxis protein [Candidatus Brocadiaceae bacterium]
MFGRMAVLTKLTVSVVVTIVIASGILTYITSKRQRTQMIAVIEEQARMAIDQLKSARKVIAKKQDIINTDAHGDFHFKGVIPAVVGREISEEFSKTTIFNMRQTSLKYRNPTNKPDAWEEKQLAKFEAHSSMQSGGIENKPDAWELDPSGKQHSNDISEVTALPDGTEVFRMIAPLSIEEACLKCHGDPATSPTGDGKDVTGRPMENYKLGEIRGGISVIAPMASVEAAVASNRKFSIWGNGIYVLVVSGVVLLISRGIMRLLKKTVHNLTGGADEVTAASAQISASSQSLAEGSSHQASSLEETSASIEEMSSVTARNADNARAANQLAIKTKNSAEYGNQALESLQTTMKELNAGNGKVLAIIKSIDDIAFQTNLLALNAAVEAARAGEHGRGFAVVAQEVRNLAQRCSTASKETTELINSRVESTENAAKIAEKFAATLKEIVEEAKKVTDLAGEISVSSQEQAEGISQISTAVSSMDTVTQQNAANAEELAAASEQLSAQADSLKAIVKELAVSMGIVEEYNASHHAYTNNPPKKVLKTSPRRMQNELAPKSGMLTKGDGFDV